MWKSRYGSAAPWMVSAMVHTATIASGAGAIRSYKAAAPNARNGIRNTT